MRASQEHKQGLIDLVNFINKKNMKMLEVGSYLGESSKIFLDTDKFDEIYCLDAWAGGYDHSDYASQNMNGVEDIFLEFANKYPETIKVYKNYSCNIPYIFEDEIFDFIYIDADHSYEGVKKDITNCLSKLKKGGFIGGHDYTYQLFDVKKAVDEILGEPDKIFQDSSWIKKI